MTIVADTHGSMTGSMGAETGAGSRTGPSAGREGFWQAGHRPTLLASFLYFDLSFMVWVLLGPLAVFIAADLGLNAAEKGLMVATPVLAGALLRLVAGLMVDRIGPRRTGIIGQLIVMAGLAAAWSIGLDGFAQVLALGLVLGVAGASFAVALPLASRWYPARHQGTALGIAGAGNSGTAFAALLAPGLAVAFGWTNVFGLALIPLAIVFVVFLVLARDAPGRPAARPLRAWAAPLASGDAWWFMLFYGVSFGGFVGLASSLTLYFNDAYGLDAVTAGYFTAGCVFAGSLVRPLGGAVADRIGGIRALCVLYLVAAAALAMIATGLPAAWQALGVFVVAMLALGMANGSVFQLVPQRFSAEIGVMTGIIGMAGGVGGFYLASSLGLARQFTGGYGAGFLIFAGLALVALGALLTVKRRWRSTWGARVDARI